MKTKCHRSIFMLVIFVVILLACISLYRKRQVAQINGSRLQRLTITVTNLNFIMVDGQVNYPGRREIQNSDFQISDALKAAGGLTDFGDPNNVTLTRSNGSILRLRLMDLEKSTNDVGLQPGDRIFVGKRM
jgi:protein involved in polysaccharide export with SLBB domain